MTTSLWFRAMSSVGALRAAWEAVLANDLDDGQESPTTQRFAQDLDARLAQLSDELLKEEFAPQPLNEVVLSSSARTLQVPPIRDRIVERALLSAVTPLIDPHLGCSSYAYRPGLGVADAVHEVALLRDEGLRWVLRTDIHDCFPSIPLRLAVKSWALHVRDPHARALLDVLLARRVRARDGRLTSVRGLPQGAPLSPLLANMVLAPIDDALRARGHPVVRYADDILIAGHDLTDINDAHQRLDTEIGARDMTLGEDKTLVTTFDDGFTFLGEDFGPKYPPSLAEGRVIEPDHKVVYAGRDGGRCRVRDGRLIVESGDNVELLSVPTNLVSRVVLLGSVALSAGARTWALNADIDVIFASRRGNYLGTMTCGGKAKAHRLRRQMEISTSSEAFDIAREIVRAKVAHQKTVLRRMGRVTHSEVVSKAISAMEHSIAIAEMATDRDELMGCEGAAAAAYFPAYGQLFPEELRFEIRSRQPPLDAANAALSFLYMILLGECVTAVRAVGLEPTIGLLHSDNDRRPSLALDLLEEFRPLIVDQVVLEAARQGRFTSSHVARESGVAGVRLTRAGRAALLDGYERRMLTRVRGAAPDFAGTWRRHVHRQAERLMRAIMAEPASYAGLAWR